MKTKKGRVYSVSAKIWLYPGESSNWHFITIPKKESKETKELYRMHTRGWGSLPVEICVRKTLWKTSIFPDSKSGTYILPIKALVRRKEGLSEGDLIKATINIEI